MIEMAALSSHFFYALIVVPYLPVKVFMLSLRPLFNFLVKKEDIRNLKLRKA